MAKVVLTTKVNPTYDDLPEKRYHFPRTYLNQLKQAVGDWIVYYEPRRQDADPVGREGRQSYFSAARLTEIVEDYSRPDHYYANVVDYLDFDRPVPFRDGKHYYETALRKADGTTNRGAFGRAVRIIPDHEYDLILQAGFASVLLAEEQTGREMPGLQEPPAEYARPIHELISRRPVRDAAFSRAVRSAYNSTCAVTGIQIINGGGRSEAEAAHIRPVGNAHNGPDSVRNGLALCKTVHWMFDRGLISLSDDYKLLVANRELPDQVTNLFHPDGQVRVPDERHLKPHHQYLRYHREHIFLGA